MTLAAGLVAVITLVILSTVPRRLAARSSAPVLLLVSGDVPAAGDWLPAALNSFAGSYRGRTQWTDVEEHGVLVGHLGTVELPVEQVSLAVRLQPHPTAGTVSRSQPLRVAIELVGFPDNSGAGRLVLGRHAAAQVLDLRDELRTEITDQVRNAGAMVTGRLASRGRWVATACALLLALTGAAAITPYAVR